MTPRIFVLAGPSGVGKGTITAELLKRTDRVWLSVSATTRRPRPGEVDGKSYYFVDDAEFDRLVETGAMLEWAVVHGTHRYGTPRAAVEKALKRGQVPLLEIDVAGARQVRISEPEAYQIFLRPPSWQELEHRLRGRHTESDAEIEVRLATARREMAAEGEFDAVVVNDSVSRATDEVLHIMGLDR
ncbi:guanylate kinase [Neoactinobaculum massilliense]|uniref:guanylate kinase n=1 Tax=Neoactinobaculum massilliense TaxID=2364794 RepID=UPI001F14AD16|nr:guanylate kinase [Neoactinobaculum massilliense]